MDIRGSPLEFIPDLIRDGDGTSASTRTSLRLSWWAEGSLLDGRQQHKDLITLLLGGFLDRSHILEDLRELHGFLLGQVDMAVFTPAHDQEYSYFVLMFQEAPRLSGLYLDIMFSRPDPQPHALHLGLLLEFFLLLVGLILLVDELAVIHDPAHRRNGAAIKFYQVQPFFFGEIQGFLERNFPHTFTPICDELHGGTADLFV